MSTPREEPKKRERQVSELSDIEEVQRGGADSTDKSTGTAPHRADEPAVDEATDRAGDRDTDDGWK
ncbi:hypothetical protein [Microlunatus soli]|uniref:Uncharacterized protein n=1 Tax=Microlunatus soli TaxID=630515 RepID=A0A1H1N7K5_9ACTN|nr:hypothetical protein [Microlunatus soli]SDR94907.1 hypothetical protein SAMN04489812_0410 [Microlunatus soli]